MSLCKNCGYRLPDNSKTCRNCDFDNRPTILCSGCRTETKEGDHCSNCGRLVQTEFSDFVLTDEVFKLEIGDEGSLELVETPSKQVSYGLDFTDQTSSIESIWSWDVTLENLTTLFAIHSTKSLEIDFSKFIALKAAYICLHNNNIPVDSKEKALQILSVEILKLEQRPWSSFLFLLSLVSIQLTYNVLSCTNNKSFTDKIIKDSISRISKKLKEENLTEFEQFLFYFNLIPYYILTKEKAIASKFIDLARLSDFSAEYSSILDRYEYDLKKHSENKEQVFKKGNAFLASTADEDLAREIAILKIHLKEQLKTPNISDIVSKAIEEFQQLEARSDQILQDIQPSKIREEILSINKIVSQLDFKSSQLQLQKLVYELENVEDEELLLFRGIISWKLASIYEAEKDFERLNNSLLLAYNDLLDSNSIPHALFVLIDLIIFSLQYRPSKVSANIQAGLVLCKENSLANFEKVLLKIEAFFDKHKNEYIFSFLLKVLKKLDKSEDIIYFLNYANDFRVIAFKEDERAKVTKVIDNTPKVSLLQYSINSLQHPFIKQIKSYFEKYLNKDKRLNEHYKILAKLSIEKINQLDTDFDFSDFLALNSLLFFPVLSKDNVDLDIFYLDKLPDFTTEQIEGIQEQLDLPADMKEFFECLTSIVWATLASSTLFLIGGIIK